MATKREIVSQLKATDLKLLADAAEVALTWHGWEPKAKKQIKRTVKILRTVRVAK